MKTALITTTINVPAVLALYRKLDPDVQFFVACDLKTPLAAYEFCATIPNCEIYSPVRQKELGYECSPLIGWNTISRRNIALLEALKWGADVIVTIDDDNIPLDKTYFDAVGVCRGNYFSGYGGGFEAPRSFNGIRVGHETDWFDVGTLLDPVSPHRGFPHTKATPPAFAPVTDARIGVAAGICLGDPDISAVTRIANAPTVHRVSELLRAGIVTDPKTTWTVVNSQNTAFVRELAPCFLMVPQWRRYDDIWASLIAQRVMRERDLYVHFGQPLVVQQRNQHDLVKDLRAEIFGMEHTLEFAEWLNTFAFPKTETNCQMVGTMFHFMNNLRWMPEGVGELGAAWVEDCRKVLG